MSRKLYSNKNVCLLVLIAMMPQLAFADALDGLPYVIGGGILAVLFQLTGIVLAIISYIKGKNWTFYSSLAIGLIGLVGFLFFLGINRELDSLMSNLFLHPSVSILLILLLSKIRTKYSKEKLIYPLSFLISLTVIFGFVISGFGNWNIVQIVNYSIAAFYSYSYANTLRKNHSNSVRKIFFQTNLLCFIGSISIISISIIKIFSIELLHTPFELLNEIFILNLLNFLEYILVIHLIGNISTIAALIINKNKASIPS